MVFFSLSGTVQAAEFNGKVIVVIDGDTLMVLRGNKPVKVRLAGIDAPEIAQPYGQASKDSLMAMVKDQTVQISSKAIDIYGRMVAVVRIGEKNINDEQVRRGMAWEYSRFNNNQVVISLQQQSQQEKRGLWAAAEAIPPAQWRKMHPSYSPNSATLNATCAKKRCSEMSSCEEARDYQTRCKIETLDGDNDGIPCEQLCSTQN